MIRLPFSAGASMGAYDAQQTMNKTGGTIALLLVVMLGATIFALIRADVPKDNQNALLILIGALTTNVTAIIAFFFGQSQANKAKDQAIVTMATTAANVQAAALPTTPETKP